VAHALRSVSVKHASAALADGYATALLVLGPKKGRAVAARLKLNVLWME
jgi:thiamine biosynthesis lipoprotein